MCYQDGHGGAFIGAKRLHHALRNEGVDSTMLVRNKASDDPSVIQYKDDVTNLQKKFNSRIVSMIPEWKKISQGTNSFNLRYTGVHQIINRSDADCVIMHWIGNDTISIRELGLITKPIIWRLADMWAFSGSRHYSNDKEMKAVENSDPSVPAIDRLIWNRKINSWRSLDMKIVCGSDWLSSKARKSKILGSYETLTIPSSLDTEIFSPSENDNYNKSTYPQSYRLLFGAHDAIHDTRKGFDLLVNSLALLKQKKTELNFELKVFGHRKKETLWFNDIKVECDGYIKNESTLAKLYNDSDLFIIPSRADNLPFTAMESLSCGTPVVGFAVGGIPEIIDHKRNGFLAKPFDCKELSEGIAWTMKQLNNRKINLRDNARKKAIKTYSYEAQARSYINLAESII